MHIETVGFNATAAAVAGTAATINTGDSATIKNARMGSKIKLLDIQAFWGSLGEVRVIGPHMNDTTEGIRRQVQASLSGSVLPSVVPELFYPQDQLAITLFGTATAGEVDTGGLVIFYEDLPGISARLLAPAELQQLGVRSAPVRTGALASTADGQWSGAVALNATTDLLKPNTAFALLGGDVSLLVGMIGVRSPDWGNVRVSFPGDVARVLGSWNYFVDLSLRSGLPCIPVLNSGNKAGIFVDCAQDDGGANPVVHLNLVELSS